MVRLRLSSGIGDFFAQFSVEISSVEELIHGHVHTVSPVVMRIGRLVDLLVLRLDRKSVV